MLQCRSWILLMWKARESIASDNARDTLVKFIHQRWESLSASQTAFLRPLKLPKTAIPANCDRKRHSFLRKDVVPDVYKFSTRFCYVSIFSCQKFSFMAFGFFGDVFLSFTPNTFIPFLVNVWVFFRTRGNLVNCFHTCLKSVQGYTCIRLQTQSIAWESQQAYKTREHFQKRDKVYRMPLNWLKNH